MRSDTLLSSVNVVLVMAYGSLVSVFLFISVSFSYLGQVYVNSRDDKPVSVVFLNIFLVHFHYRVSVYKAYYFK